MSSWCEFSAMPWTALCDRPTCTWQEQTLKRCYFDSKHSPILILHKMLKTPKYLHGLVWQKVYRTACLVCHIQAKKHAFGKWRRKRHIFEVHPTMNELFNRLVKLINDLYTLCKSSKARHWLTFLGGWNTAYVYAFYLAFVSKLKTNRSQENLLTSQTDSFANTGTCIG